MEKRRRRSRIEERIEDRGEERIEEEEKKKGWLTAELERKEESSGKTRIRGS